MHSQYCKQRPVTWKIKDCKIMKYPALCTETFSPSCNIIEVIVMLSLCMSWRHTWRSRGIAPLHLNLGTWYRWWSTSHLDPFHFAENHQYPLNKWLDGPLSQSGCCAEKFLAPVRNPTLDSSAYRLVTIHIMLSWLLTFSPIFCNIQKTGKQLSPLQHSFLVLILSLAML